MSKPDPEFSQIVAAIRNIAVSNIAKTHLCIPAAREIAANRIDPANPLPPRSPKPGAIRRRLPRGECRARRASPPPPADTALQWYYVALDPLLWRTLDFSHLRVLTPATAPVLRARLAACSSFTLQSPRHLTAEATTAVLHFLAASPHLHTLTLARLGAALHSPALESHFRFSRARALARVDLSHSRVTTPAVVALLERHAGTLRALDLSHTRIGDGTLRAVSAARALRSLDISACAAISRTSIRNFLARRFPARLEALALRGLRDVKITWLYDLMKASAAAGGALRALDVHGCERLSLGDLRALQAAWAGVVLGHDARDAADSVWGYRRYIEFLAGAPTLPERLAGEASGSTGAPEKEAAGHAAAAAAAAAGGRV